MNLKPAHVVAIVNPETRRNTARIEEILWASVPPGGGLEFYRTRFAGHATELAREHADAADILLAVGGDGTVAEVAGVARATGKPLAIVPAGSTNIIARELGIPTNAQRAAKVVFGHHAIRRIDAGVCGDRTFLHMAGAGIDSLLFAQSRPQLKRRVGWVAYVPAAIAAMQLPRNHYTISSAERTLRDVVSPLVLVANGPSIIAPRFQLDREVLLDDGLLDVFVVTATSASQLARVIASMVKQRLGGSPFVETWRTREVTIEATPGIVVQLDGDVAGVTPVTLSLVPEALSVVVPA